MKKNIIITVSICVLIGIISAFCIHFYFKQNQNKEIKANNNKVAHIVFTTDKNYLKYLNVAIFSAIKNKNPNSIYDINILCVDLSEKEQQSFKKFEQKNVSIKTIPVSIEELTFGYFEILNVRVSRADLFKFLMPKIFENYDKILYLDADILVRGDLLDLYNTDLKNHYLGAVLKYSPNITVIHIPFRKILMHYDYNCGVMLLNLDKMRKNNITKKLIVKKNKDKLRALMTQTTFNQVIPVRKIIKLSPIYNFYARLQEDDFNYFELKRVYSPYLNDINSIDELAKAAVIVHYAGPEKPWYDNNTDLQYAFEWRKYAKMENPKWVSDGYKYQEVE